MKEQVASQQLQKAESIPQAAMSLEGQFVNSVIQRLTFIFSELVHLKQKKGRSRLKNSQPICQSQNEDAHQDQDIRNEQWLLRQIDQQRQQKIEEQMSKRLTEINPSGYQEKKNVMLDEHQEERQLLVKNNQHQSGQLQIRSVEQISSLESEYDQQESENFSNKAVSSKKKGKEQKRDEPKKPISSFVHFYAARTKEIRKNNQLSTSIGNLAQYLSNQWSHMSQKQKFPYQLAASQSLKTYYNQKQMRLKEQIMNDEGKLLSQQKKKQVISAKENQNQGENKKLENQMRRGSVSSFFVFFKYNSQKIAKKYNENQRGKLAKLASQQWKNMSESQKKIYMKISKLQRQKEQEPEKIQTKKKFIKKKQKKEEYDEYKPKIYKKLKKRSKVERKDQDFLEQEKDVNNPQNEETQNKNVSVDNSNSLSIGSKLEPIEEEVQEDSQSERYHLRYTSKAKIPKTINIIELNSNEQSDQDKSEFKQVQKVNKKHQNTNSNPPKQPVNAFLMYYQQSLKDIKAQHEKARGSELVKIASTRWAELSEAQQLVYYDLANERKKKYDILMRSQRKDGEKFNKKRRKIQKGENMSYQWSQ